MLSKRLLCFTRIPTKAFHLSAARQNATNSINASKILENKILGQEKISIILSEKNLNRNYDGHRDGKELAKTKNFNNFKPDDIEELRKSFKKLQKLIEDLEKDYESRKKVERITKIAQGCVIFFFTIFFLEWIFDT